MEPRAIDEIGAFGDVAMDVLIELDRKVLTVRDILGLEPGHVLKMSRSAGENLDVLIGGALMAFGEIVIIESTMGVRITDFNQEE